MEKTKTEHLPSPREIARPTRATVVLGIKPWKRWQIRRFLDTPDRQALLFASSPSQALGAQARRGGAIAVWASREPEGFGDAAAAQGAPLLRIEDGFIRSIGLGSNHIGGASHVIDDIGIYFDPRTPSALERTLQQTVFDPGLTTRAARLRHRLVHSGLTKYNVGATAPLTLGGQPGQRRVLVVGQVEDDASVRTGSPNVRTNAALLEQVRADEPGAWLVYKPHPETEAGNRPGRLDPHTVSRYADEVVCGQSMTALFPEIDALHTLTSLAGFEALMRGIPVTTWGQPFYAGWGLTDDRLPIARRTRRLTLDELVAGSLILYPHYRHPRTGAPCEVEVVVEALAASGSAAPRAQRSALIRFARLCHGWMRDRKAGRG